MRFVSFLLLCLWGLLGTSCTTTLPSAERLNGSATLQAFAGPEASLQTHTAMVLGGNGGALCLAMPAGRDGLWATKGSAIGDSGALRLRLNGQAWPASLVGVDRVSDVALLRVAGTENHPVPIWASTPAEGAWVAAMSERRGMRVGIVSGATRRIEVPQTMLGIMMEPDDPNPGALIDEVVDGGMAERAKLREGDRILAINGQPVASYRTLQRIVRALEPGDRVYLDFERNGRLYQRSVPLGDEMTNSGEHRNLRMSGPVSQRRAGFEEAFQHDCPLDPASMGGPLVNLQGELVGMNIARRDRVTTFTLSKRALRRALFRIRVR